MPLVNEKALVNQRFFVSYQSNFVYHEIIANEILPFRDTQATFYTTNL